MSFSEIFQQLVNGLTLTAIYAMIAVGMSLFFGAIGIVNLAHGDVASVGVFLALAVQYFLPLSGLTAKILAGILVFPIGIGGAGLIGWALYRFAFRPLGEVPAVIGLLASIACGFILRESIFNFYPGARNPLPFETVIPPLLLEFRGIVIHAKQLFVIIAAVITVLSLSGLIERTRFGRSIRSIVNNREVSRLLGVPVERVIGRTFVLGGALAGLGGVLNGTYYNQVSFDMGIMLTTKGFIAAVLGGLGNFYGAFIGALVVGLLETFTIGFVPQGSSYKDPLVFGILILILILKPEGILGRKLTTKV